LRSRTVDYCVVILEPCRAREDLFYDGFGEGRYKSVAVYRATVESLAFGPALGLLLPWINRWLVRASKS